MISSETLAVENMAVAGDRLVWANQMMGGGCVCPGPQTPYAPEQVESVPLKGGSSASLLRVPGDVDPGVYVLGDSRFSYVVEAAGAASSIVAIPPSGGAQTTLVPLGRGRHCHLGFVQHLLLIGQSNRESGQADGAVVTYSVIRLVVMTSHSGRSALRSPAMSKAFTREDDDAGFALASHAPVVKGPITAIGARLAAEKVEALGVLLYERERAEGPVVLEIRFPE